MTQIQMMENAGELEVDFLYEIYSWLSEDRNQSVEEYHSSLLALYSKKNLIENSRLFVKQRLLFSDARYKKVNILTVAKMYTAGLYEGIGIEDMDQIHDDESVSDFDKRIREAV